MAESLELQGRFTSLRLNPRENLSHRRDLGLLGCSQCFNRIQNG